MEPKTILIIVSLFVAAVGMVGLMLMRRRLLSELAASKKKEEELERRAYESAILKEIGDRIGYSLDAVKIVEIISGSLGKLLVYSTVSYMILDKKNGKIIFFCNVNESISSGFIREVKVKMLTAFSEMVQKPLVSSDIDESISGTILDEQSEAGVGSFFNLPIIISGEVFGIINVSSTKANLYNDEDTEFLYKIARQASDAVSKLQEVLENEKGRLAQAVESLSDGLLMVDTRYELVLVNRKLTQLLETYEEPELFDIVNSLSGSLDIRSMIEETLSSNDDLPPRELVVKEKVLQVLASKVMDARAGRPLGVVVLFRDITDAKSLEKLRADFTSMMVHELRSPLTSIKSTVELLKSDFLKIKPEEASKFLENINSTSQTMLEVVNDLLDVAKMESGSFDVVVEKGPVGQYIEDRVEVYKVLASARNLKLSAEVEKGLPEAYFDKVRIKQVLNNLISNALKFTHVGEVKVKVETLKSGNEVREITVSVVDTGIGIDPEEGRRLFSRFGQLVRSRRTAALGGSGLGLYIAKGIVEAWGGSIWYKSDGVGMGSSFCFTVPVIMSKSDIMPSPSAVSSFKVDKVAHA